jgi:hypothetical protein
MSASLFRGRVIVQFVGTSFLLLIQIASGQDQAAPTLLRLQRSRTTGEVDATGGMHAPGGNIYALGAAGSQMATSSYPNSGSCIVVYNDGKYAFERRDESTVGKPKVRSAEGTLGGDDLQQLKAILDNEELKKVTGLKPPETPANAAMLREAEMMEVVIDREGQAQQFVAVKERFKTQGSTGVSTAAGTGMDVYLDNASAYRKNLNPLVKWFEGVEKKSKSSLKESKPQYCTAMTF